jgi:hypothetical protein
VKDGKIYANIAAVLKVHNAVSPSVSTGHRLRR